MVKCCNQVLNYCKKFLWRNQNLDSAWSPRILSPGKFTCANLNLLLVNLNQEVTIKPKAKSFYVVIQKYTYIIGEIWNKYFFQEQLVKSSKNLNRT